VECLHALDGDALGNRRGVLPSQRQSRYFVHVPVGEVLGRQVVATDIRSLCVIKSSCRQRHHKESIIRLNPFDEPGDFDLADDR
jgi:hypothetical protein